MQKNIDTRGSHPSRSSGEQNFKGSAKLKS